MEPSTDLSTGYVCTEVGWALSPTVQQLDLEPVLKSLPFCTLALVVSKLTADLLLLSRFNLPVFSFCWNKYWSSYIEQLTVDSKIIKFRFLNHCSINIYLMGTEADTRASAVHKIYQFQFGSDYSHTSFGLTYHMMIYASNDMYPKEVTEFTYKALTSYMSRPMMTLVLPPVNDSSYRQSIAEEPNLTGLAQGQDSIRGYVFALGLKSHPGFVLTSSYEDLTVFETTCEPSSCFSHLAAHNNRLHGNGKNVLWQGSVELRNLTEHDRYRLGDKRRLVSLSPMHRQFPLPLMSTIALAFYPLDSNATGFNIPTLPPADISRALFATRVPMFFTDPRREVLPPEADYISGIDEPNHVLVTAYGTVRTRSTVDVYLHPFEPNVWILTFLLLTVGMGILWRCRTGLNALQTVFKTLALNYRFVLEQCNYNSKDATLPKLYVASWLLVTLTLGNMYKMYLKTSFITENAYVSPYKSIVELENFPLYAIFDGFQCPGLRNLTEVATSAICIDVPSFGQCSIGRARSEERKAGDTNPFMLFYKHLDQATYVDKIPQDELATIEKLKANLYYSCHRDLPRLLEMNRGKDKVAYIINEKDFKSLWPVFQQANSEDNSTLKFANNFKAKDPFLRNRFQKGFAFIAGPMPYQQYMVHRLRRLVESGVVALWETWDSIRFRGQNVTDGDGDEFWNIRPLNLQESGTLLILKLHAVTCLSALLIFLFENFRRYVWPLMIYWMRTSFARAGNMTRGWAYELENYVNKG